TPAKRLDTPAKVNGKAEYGIDVRLPGMKIATVAASPVVGGKLVSVDDSKARAIKGVRQIVRLDDAVAVVADHMWAAKQGLAARRPTVGGRRDSTESSTPPMSSRGSPPPRRRRARSCETRGTRRRFSRERRRSSNRCTRFPSSRTRRWSR